MPAARPDDALHDGGRKLWDELAPGGVCGPGELSVITEACRIKDRLDQLAKLCDGDISTWVDLVETYEGSGIAEITLNKPLAEARQQALAFKQLIAELRQMRGGKLARTSAGGSVADDLAAQRAKRLAGTPGPQRP